MKKLFAFGAALLVAGAMNAQLTSKKGEAYLPASGDWSIGIDGTSAINYFGNMLNNSAGNGLAYNYTNANNMITGKMFTSDNTAYRAALRIGMNSNSVTTPVASSADPTKTVDNVTKTSNNFVGLGAGMEYRRGATRLQGYYGAMAMLTYAGGGVKNTYGNDALAGDVMEVKNGTSIGFGLRGFIGVEYFVLPKISVGGEFGWGVGFNSTGASTTTVANGDGTNTDVTGGKGSTFSLDTDNNAFGMAPAALLVNFHF